MKSFMIDLAGAVFDNLTMVYHFSVGFVIVSEILFGVVDFLNFLSGS